MELNTFQRYNSAIMKNAKTASKKLLVLGAVFLLASCGENSLSWSGSRYYSMDTWFTVQSSDDGSLKADSSALEAENDKIGAIFDSVYYCADGERKHDVVSVYDVNRATSPIEVSEQLYDLLQFSCKMQEATDGYFNPLCGNLASLWKKALRNIMVDENGYPVTDALGNPIYDPYIPEQGDINACLQEIRNSRIALSEKDGKKYAYVSVKDDTLGRAKIDLGGIAKGYAVELANQQFLKDGYKHYLINGGNSSIAFGQNIANEGKFRMGWTVDLPGYHVEVKDCIVGTSSMTVQGSEIDGRLYSHIVNPFTGEASPDITGVTILGKDAGILDALTTALMWAPEEVRAKLEKAYDLKAVYYKDKAVVANHDFPLIKND